MDGSLGRSVPLSARVQAFQTPKMAGMLADAELAAEAAAGLAINIAQDKAAADQEAASIPILYDQLLETSTRSNLLLNHTPGLGFHMMEQKIGSATVTLPMGKFIIMNNYLPFAPPQLKDRINPDHWLGFVEELNESGTPNPDCLLACGMYMSCTCCWLGPKIKAEFEQKVDAAIEKHIGFFKPHVKAMKRAQTDIQIWNPSTDPMVRGSWSTQTLYYISIECTESGWVPPPRDETPISNLEKMTAYV